MAAQQLCNRQKATESAFILLDSAISELNKMKDFKFAYDQNNGANDPRKALILALSSVGGHQMHNLAGKYVEQISLSNQDDVVERWIEGAAASGQYYVAYASIPDITSTAEDSIISTGYCCGSL